MNRIIKYTFFLLLFSFCACKKDKPQLPKPNPVVPAIQYPLLSKLTLITPSKTYTETYIYDTVSGFRNNPLVLRSEITGKIIKFTYAMDIYFRHTINKISEYDINTNQLIDAYQYTGYQTDEPGIPPDEKEVRITDANNKPVKTFVFFKQEVDSMVNIITLGLDTTHLSFDSHHNLAAFEPEKTSLKITYTYDDKHNPLALLPNENEHLSYYVYSTPQSFVNNPLTITTGSVTKTYTYQYNQYGYPTSAKVTDGSTIKYEYVARK